MTSIKVLLENFKKYSMKEEESVPTGSRYDFRRDEEYAERKIAEKGFKNIKAEYEEGYEDERASNQDFDDYITDMSHSGKVKGEFFMPIEQPIPVPVNSWRDTFKPLLKNIFEAIDDEFGTEVFAIFPRFVSDGKDPTKLSKNNIVGILFELQSVQFEYSEDPEDYEMEQLDSVLEWYKMIDDNVERVKQVALDEISKLKK